MRRALLVAALLVGALAPAWAAVPARAAALGACSTTRGTVVAVDFAPFADRIVRGCGVTSAGQPDASGLALLEDGGFTPVGTRQYGLAFICRLGNAAVGGGADYPTDASCDQTPPASSSWSFWLAKPGATAWTYSPDGATADRPVSGEVELWTFGNGATPASSLIPALRATNATTPPPRAPTPTKPTAQQPTSTAPAPAPATTAPPAAGVPTTAAATSGSSPGAAAPSSSGSATSRGPRPSAASSAPSPTGPSASPQIVAAAAAPATHRSAGSPLPVILAAVLVALLAGGAGVAAWQRRRG